MMFLPIAAIIGPAEAWVACAIVTLWMVFMCIKTIASDLDYAIRWHDLKVEVQALRSKQMRRLRELGVKAKSPRR